MAGNMLLKLGQSAVEKKYGGKNQKTDMSKKSRGKKLDSFHYWGPKVEKAKDGTLMVNELKVGAHVKSAAYYENLGLPHGDAQVLARVKRQAMVLDGGYTVPVLHIKFGISAIIGLLPVGGDAVDVILAALIVSQASRVSGGLDGKIRKKMIINVFLDGAIGITPGLGDVADIFFRCNTKNANMLEEMLLSRVKHNAKVVRDAEKMGSTTAHGHGGRYKHQARPSVPQQYEDGHDGHDGLRQRLPAQADGYSVKRTRASTSEKGWLARLKARAQDVGTMDDVLPVKRPPRPQDDGQF